MPRIKIIFVPVFFSSPEKKAQVEFYEFCQQFVYTYPSELPCQLQ